MSTYERIAAACPDLGEVPARDGTPSYEINPADVGETLRLLRDEAGFDSITFVTAIDRGDEPRFEVSWQLLSIEHGDRVRVRARVLAEDPRIASVTDLWPGADYMERECFDMFGVVFEGHPDLKRLLMPDGYDYFPLRKEFPHHGIEPDRLYRAWERERSKGQDQ